jgi:peroxiredoxin Q/BCP
LWNPPLVQILFQIAGVKIQFKKFSTIPRWAVENCIFAGPLKTMIMITLKVGDPAPDINTFDENGNPVNLKDYSGNKVILFFYPKANTPGCTAEACDLRDHYSALTEKGFKIIGVSADSEKSQQNFSRKYSFPYPLIPDTEKKVITDYGVWGKKKLYGKEYEGINRTTFVISESGKIEHIFTKVKTKEHTDQILSHY